MDPNPEFVYDELNEVIFLESDESRVEVYSEASHQEFELIKAAHQVPDDISVLFAAMNQTTEGLGALTGTEDYFGRISSIAEDAANLYERCTHLQGDIEESSSEIVSAQLDPLYKSEKNLKHFLRCLSAAQSLGYSQRLLLNYVETRDRVFLLGFLRNVCSTVEFLGILVENRIGEGNLNRDDKGLNFARVYRELENQSIGRPFNENESVNVLPFDESMRLGDVPLDTDLLDHIRFKRNKIAHRSPLVVSEETLNYLPDEIVNTAVLSDADMDYLLFLSHRLHYHSIGMYFRLCAHYEKNAIKSFSDAISMEQ